jgi:hypothetical protein
MLESPADGFGCWALPDTTLAGIGTNATFASFAKLCEGGYGSRCVTSMDWINPLQYMVHRSTAAAATIAIVCSSAMHNTQGKLEAGWCCLAKAGKLTADQHRLLTVMSSALRICESSQCSARSLPDSKSCQGVIAVGVNSA